MAGTPAVTLVGPRAKCFLRARVWERRELNAASRALYHRPKVGWHPLQLELHCNVACAWIAIGSDVIKDCGSDRGFGQLSPNLSSITQAEFNLSIDNSCHGGSPKT